MFFRALIAAFLIMTPLAVKAETVFDRVQRTGTLRCGFLAWPMYFDIDPNTKQVSGISKELTEAALHTLGLKVYYIEVTSASKVTDLQSGKVDAICGDGPYVLTSLMQVNYTRPFFYAPVYLYDREDEKRFQKLLDINAKQVIFVGMDGDLSVELVQKNFPMAKLNTVASTVDVSLMLMDVATKKADLTIMDPGGADNFIKHNSGKVKKIFGDKPFAVYGVGFSVKKGETELFNTLNGAVEALQNTSSIDPILDRYDPSNKLFVRTAPNYRQ